MTRTFRSIAAAIGLAFAPTSAILAGGCPLDLDSSGAVDGADLGVMLAAWGTATHDATGDGVVDGADLGILLAAWGACPADIEWTLVTATNSGSTVAYDAQWNPVRTWTGATGGASVAYLRPDGSLVRPCVLPGGGFNAGGRGGRIQVFAPDGSLAARYDKIHMFDVQLNAGNIYRESDSYAAGGAAVLATLPFARLGMTVCYDVRFPELFRQLATAGAQIIAVPSAFTRITGEAHWHTLMRARAIETGCYVIAPAQAGRHEDGRETYGHSLIVDPWGEILAEGITDPGVIAATLDLAKVDEVRGKIPSLRHVRSFAAPRG